MTVDEKIDKMIELIILSICKSKYEHCRFFDIWTDKCDTSNADCCNFKVIISELRQLKSKNDEDIEEFI